MYRPLPNGITITKSGIDGLGVVATKTFKANIVLGIAHIVNKSFPHGYIRTALGAFYNHSDEPNCQRSQIRVKPNFDKWSIMTLEDIEEGEELTFEHHPNVYFDFELNGERIPRIEVNIFWEVNPRDLENFMKLVTGECGFGYKGGIMHEIDASNKMIGGDITE